MSKNNDILLSKVLRKYLPNVELKDYNVMIVGKNFFDGAIKDEKVTYETITKIVTGQGDDYTRGCLLDYPCLQDSCKMVAVDLSKQQILDTDHIAIQQINFTADSNRGRDNDYTRIYFILENATGTVLDFSQVTEKVL